MPMRGARFIDPIFWAFGLQTAGKASNRKRFALPASASILLIGFDVQCFGLPCLFLELRVQHRIGQAGYSCPPRRGII